MNEQIRLGIMGGTFDPIHYGHLAIAEEAKEQFNLKRVIFIPCGHPPHKKAYPVSNPEDRYEMTRLAIADNRHFEIARIEIDRTGLSYSIDTITELRRLYPGAEIYFITGADAVLEILSWKEPYRLVEQCRLIAVARPGYDMASFSEKVGSEFADKLLLLTGPAINISSTEIRRRVAAKTSIRYLLPEAVRAYIEEKGLYCRVP
jgi:nicotinate-nucleotide adenylyltransferase